jgi:hypothetical protein
MASRLNLFWALPCWLLVACAATGKNLPQSPTKITQLDSSLTVDAVAKEPKSWAGKKVKVEGNFSGWQGKCTGRPPVSRSDWMMENDTACVYVSGRLPPELSSISPARGIGKPIVVMGEVFIDGFGKPYIQSERISIRE